jgi:Peptidase M10 serralysin C terminal
MLVVETISIANLVGSRFADTLIGNDRANQITGGLGRDVLSGGGGRDRFVFNIRRDSPPGAHCDRVTDFEAGVDKIVLRAIDAKKRRPGNQRFTFVGTGPFTSTKGELRVEQVGTSAVVQGDINGDGGADFEIELLNFTASTLSATDVVR